MLQVLNEHNKTQLANKYQQALDLMAKTALMMYYQGNGIVLGVTFMKNNKSQPTPDNYYRNDDYLLDDPYEGELFAFFLDLYAHWNDSKYAANITGEKDAIWSYKRAKLQKATFQSKFIFNRNF